MIRINKTDNILNVYNKNNKIKKSEEKKQKSDGIQLSKEAIDYQFAMKKVKEAPDIRRDKVDTLKAQIDSGKYKVDSGKIADKILENVQAYKKYNSW